MCLGLQTIHPGRRTVACQQQHSSGHSAATAPISLWTPLYLMPWLLLGSWSTVHHARDGSIPRHYWMGSLCHGDGFHKAPTDSKRLFATLPLIAPRVILDLRTDHPTATGNTLPVDLYVHPGIQSDHRHTHLGSQGWSVEGNWPPAVTGIRRPSGGRQVLPWMQLQWAGHNKWGTTGVLASCHPGSHGSSQATRRHGHVKVATHHPKHIDMGIILPHVQVSSCICSASLWWAEHFPGNTKSWKERALSLRFQLQHCIPSSCLQHMKTPFGGTGLGSSSIIFLIFLVVLFYINLVNPLKFFNSGLGQYQSLGQSSNPRCQKGWRLFNHGSGVCCVFTMCVAASSGGCHLLYLKRYKKITLRWG